MSVPPLIRAACEEDCALIFEMVRELADYERLSGEALGRLADTSLGALCDWSSSSPWPATE